MDTKELDRETTQKNKVRVQITLQDAKTYRLIAEDLKNLTASVNGTMAVKMVCG